VSIVWDRHVAESHGWSPPSARVAWASVRCLCRYLGQRIASVRAMPRAANYSDEEVKEILEHALARVGGDPAGTSRQDLLAIGEQVGIPADVMAAAAEEVLRARSERQAHESKRARRRRWLMAHALLFAVANLLMFGVNYATTPGEWWVAFPIFFWGLALAAHAGVARWLSAAVHKRSLAMASQPRSARLRVPSAEHPVEPQDESEAADDAVERGQSAKPGA
jgi:hypothetical protein